MFYFGQICLYFLKANSYTFGFFLNPTEIVSKQSLKLFIRINSYFGLFVGDIHANSGHHNYWKHTEITYAVLSNIYLFEWRIQTILREK